MAMSRGHLRRPHYRRFGRVDVNSGLVVANLEIFSLGMWISFPVYECPDLTTILRITQFLPLTRKSATSPIAPSLAST